MKEPTQEQQQDASLYTGGPRYGVGSVAPDLDHILPPFQRSWGCEGIVPLVLLFLCLVVAPGSRLSRNEVLKWQKKLEREMNCGSGQVCHKALTSPGVSCRLCH